MRIRYTAPGIPALDVPALGALVAVFRFKAGILPVLAACSMVGAVWTLIN